MNGNYNNFYVDFAHFPPDIYSVNNQYTFLRTMTFMSNVNGTPVFYSNGCNIQNADHELIQNGGLPAP